MANVLNIPLSPPINIKTGDWQPEWRQWIQSPTFLSIDTGAALGVTSGGTGLSTAPSSGQFLIGNLSGGYTLSSLIPASALPAFTGDVTKTAGGTVLTLVTLPGLSAGVYGSSQIVPVITVNVKGQITAVNNTAIDGTVGNFAVSGALTSIGAFGCNGKPAQASAVVNAAIAGTAGAAYTATEQGLINSLLALVNQLRAALVANGITV